MATLPCSHLHLRAAAPKASSSQVPPAALPLPNTYLRGCPSTATFSPPVATLPGGHPSGTCGCCVLPRTTVPWPSFPASPWLSPLPLLTAHCPPQGTGSESEDGPPQHSFVNHYMSDPTYYNSWKRRAPHRYEAVAGAEVGPHLHTVVTTQSAVFAPAGPGTRTPLTGFSSFV